MHSACGLPSGSRPGAAGGEGPSAPWCGANGPRSTPHSASRPRHDWSGPQDIIRVPALRSAWPGGTTFAGLPAICIPCGIPGTRFTRGGLGFLLVQMPRHPLVPGRAQRNPQPAPPRRQTIFTMGTRRRPGRARRLTRTPAHRTCTFHDAQCSLTFRRSTRTAGQKACAPSPKAHEFPAITVMLVGAADSRSTQVPQLGCFQTEFRTGRADCPEVGALSA